MAYDKKKERVLIHLEPDSRYDVGDLSAVVIDGLIKSSGEEPTRIELLNNPKEPFKVVSRPGGQVMWGVGGCGVDI